MSQTASIVLIGNPNCGKTTLFNALTGSRQRVGNWPGVTVERKTGNYRHADLDIEIVDLPGMYNLESSGTSDAIDEDIARDFLRKGDYDAVVNVVDASSLARGLFLSTQLLDLDVPLIVVLNMTDVAHRQGIHLDPSRLSEALGCPVVPMVASRREGLGILEDVIEIVISDNHVQDKAKFPHGFEARYQQIDSILVNVVHTTPVRHTLTDMVDSVVLHPVLAFPIFLFIMYLMFMFTINVGTALIDFFDLTALALFVEAPRLLLQSVGLPDWLIIFIADGVGGGVQLVCTFIPIIGCMFLFLSFLEDSGYLGRAAFIIDRLMKGIGLPGKSFVPLIVGFGCNVPSVMASRTLDNQQDRILTTIMAPFMSCGARLTVYVLFATAFFENNGQNVVFALYLCGIAIAVLSALIVRTRLLTRETSSFVMELPAYHLPTLNGLVIHSWHRLKGFVLRAGKAIVIVVVILNVISSIGTDGSVNNQNTERSILSAIGRTLTPLFGPMGIKEDNWPATVGIFSGIFAKEVVVGTLDALYSNIASEGAATVEDKAFDFGATFYAAIISIPNNFAGLADLVTNPLGINVGDLTDTRAAAAEQEVTMGTIDMLRGLFDGDLGAFSYLLFVLLYMPCVATVGAIYKELGSFWTIFSTTWSVIMAYTIAVIFYQAGQLMTDFNTAAGWIAGMLLMQLICFTALIQWGRRRIDLIPAVNI
jgi:ferrous iron transport protein B